MKKAVFFSKLARFFNTIKYDYSQTYETYFVLTKFEPGYYFRFNKNVNVSFDIVVKWKQNFVFYLIYN